MMKLHPLRCETCNTKKCPIMSESDIKPIDGGYHEIDETIKRCGCASHSDITFSIIPNEGKCKRCVEFQQELTVNMIDNAVNCETDRITGALQSHAIMWMKTISKIRYRDATQEKNIILSFIANIAYLRDPKCRKDVK